MDPVAGVDQEVENARQLARLLGGYMKALIEQGFNRPEAISLVRDYYADRCGQAQPED